MRNTREKSIMHEIHIMGLKKASVDNKKSKQFSETYTQCKSNAK